MTKPQRELLRHNCYMHVISAVSIRPGTNTPVGTTWTFLHVARSNKAYQKVSWTLRYHIIGEERKKNRAWTLRRFGVQCHPSQSVARRVQ